MQKNATIFLWLILIGTAGTLQAMNPSDKQPHRSGAKAALQRAATIRTMRPIIRKKKPAQPETSTIQFANGQPRQAPTTLFGDMPWSPQDTGASEYGKVSNVRQDNSSSSDEEHPYAKASDVQFETDPCFGLPIPTAAMSRHAISEPSSPTKEPTPALRKATSDEGPNRTKHVSMAFKALRGGLKQATAALGHHAPTPADDTTGEQRKPPSQPLVVTISMLTPSNPKGEAATATYGNAALVQPAEGGDIYGNVPEDFTGQLQTLLQQDGFSIPEAMRLIQQGADLLTRNVSGNTILHLLATAGNDGAISSLCEAFPCNPNVLLNDQKETPLDYALGAKQWNAAAELIKYGAIPYHTDEQGNTIFHNAASAGSTNLMTQLIAQEKGDINARNCSGQTPLHIAILHNHTAAALFLLEHGATLLPDKHGKEPLDCAVATQTIKVIRALLERDEYSPEKRKHLVQKTANKQIRSLLRKIHTQPEETK